MADTYTAFVGQECIASGSLLGIAGAVKAASDAGKSHLVVFDDTTGRTMELDLRGSHEDVLERLQRTPAASTPTPAPRGRPKLGVTAREVTLLPTHWEWLAAQPGGASATLRRLVDTARRSGRDKHREAQEAARRVMLVLAGDLPGFEEASRAFYAGNYLAFEELSAAWPRDVGDYVRTLVGRAATLVPGSVAQP